MHGSSGFGHGHSHGGLDLGCGSHGGFAGDIHGLHFGHDGHAGEVTLDAIIVGHSFAPHHTAPHIDTSVDGHGVGAVADGTMEGNGPSFDVPADSGRTKYGILVVGCGSLDWETRARKMLVDLGLVECYNLQPPNPLVSPAQRYDVILPANFKKPTVVVNDPVQPRGLHQGAIGSTTIWRTNWEVGERSYFARKAGRPATRKVGCRTYLEVDFTVWHYAIPDDYEFRIVVKAIGGKDRSELMDHVNAARAFCKGMLTTLQATPPSSDAKRYREQSANRR